MLLRWANPHYSCYTGGEGSIKTPPFPSQQDKLRSLSAPTDPTQCGVFATGFVLPTLGSPQGIKFKSLGWGQQQPFSQELS